MKRKIEKIGILSLYHVFSFLGLFIKTKKITKKKIIYGALIVGLTASVSGCRIHRHTCYAPAFTDNLELNDSTKTTSLK